MALISAEKDPMGQAIADYYRTGEAKRLRVISSMFDEDDIPVSTLFRGAEQMNAMERTALDAVYGRILDVGAGSGCHSLVLQERGHSVTAIDVSPLSVETMRKRGVEDARLADFYEMECDTRYDTLLMLMNGSGIIGTLQGMERFFDRLNRILAPGGQVLMDSSDLRYVYEDEEGEMDWNPEWGYYGEVDYRMQYGRVKGEPFDWLYVDLETLKRYAEENGYCVTLLALGEHYDYLAQLKRKVI